MTLSLDLAPADAERYARLRAFRQSWWDAGRGDPPLSAIDGVLKPVGSGATAEGRKRRQGRPPGARNGGGKTGVKGVWATPYGTFAAEVRRRGVRYRLGTFKTLDAAAKVAARAYDRIERGLEP